MSSSNKDNNFIDREDFVMDDVLEKEFDKGQFKIFCESLKKKVIMLNKQHQESMHSYDVMISDLELRMTDLEEQLSRPLNASIISKQGTPLKESNFLHKSMNDSCVADRFEQLHQQLAQLFNLQELNRQTNIYLAERMQRQIADAAKFKELFAKQLSEFSIHLSDLSKQSFEFGDLTDSSFSAQAPVSNSFLSGTTNMTGHQSNLSTTPTPKSPSVSSSEKSFHSAPQDSENSTTTSEDGRPQTMTFGDGRHMETHVGSPPQGFRNFNFYASPIMPTSVGQYSPMGPHFVPANFSHFHSPMGPSFGTTTNLQNYWTSGMCSVNPTYLIPHAMYPHTSPQNEVPNSGNDRAHSPPVSRCTSSDTVNHWFQQKYFSGSFLLSYKDKSGRTELCAEYLYKERCGSLIRLEIKTPANPQQRPSLPTTIYLDISESQAQLGLSKDHKIPLRSDRSSRSRSVQGGGFRLVLNPSRPPPRRSKDDDRVPAPVITTTSGEAQSTVKAQLVESRSSDEVSPSLVMPRPAEFVKKDSRAQSAKAEASKRSATWEEQVNSLSVDSSSEFSVATSITSTHDVNDLDEKFHTSFVSHKHLRKKRKTKKQGILRLKRLLAQFERAQHSAKACPSQCEERERIKPDDSTKDQIIKDRTSRKHSQTSRKNKKAKQKHSNNLLESNGKSGLKRSKDSRNISSSPNPPDINVSVDSAPTPVVDANVSADSTFEILSTKDKDSSESEIASEDHCSDEEGVSTTDAADASMTICQDASVTAEVQPISPPAVQTATSDVTNAQMFAQLLHKMEQMDERFEKRLDQQMQRMDERFDKRFEVQSKQMNERFEVQSQQMNERFDVQSQQMNEQRKTIKEELNERFDVQTQQMKQINERFDVQTQQMKQMNERFEMQIVELKQHRSRSSSRASVRDRIASTAGFDTQGTKIRHLDEPSTFESCKIEPKVEDDDNIVAEDHSKPEPAADDVDVKSEGDVDVESQVHQIVKPNYGQNAPEYRFQSLLAEFQPMWSGLENYEVAYNHQLLGRFSRMNVHRFQNDTANVLRRALDEFLTPNVYETFDLKFLTVDQQEVCLECFKDATTATLAHHFVHAAEPRVYQAFIKNPTVHRMMLHDGLNKVFLQLLQTKTDRTPAFVKESTSPFLQPLFLEIWGQVFKHGTLSLEEGKCLRKLVDTAVQKPQEFQSKFLDITKLSAILRTAPFSSLKKGLIQESFELNDTSDQEYLHEGEESPSQGETATGIRAGATATPEKAAGEMSWDGTSPVTNDPKRLPVESSPPTEYAKASLDRYESSAPHQTRLEKVHLLLQQHVTLRGRETSKLYCTDFREILSSSFVDFSDTKEKTYGKNLTSTYKYDFSMTKSRVSIEEYFDKWTKMYKIRQYFMVHCPSFVWYIDAAIAAALTARVCLIDKDKKGLLGTDTKWKNPGADFFSNLDSTILSLIVSYRAFHKNREGLLPFLESMMEHDHMRDLYNMLPAKGTKGKILVDIPGWSPEQFELMFSVLDHIELHNDVPTAIGGKALDEDQLLLAEQCFENVLLRRVHDRSLLSLLSLALVPPESRDKLRSTISTITKNLQAQADDALPFYPTIQNLVNNPEDSLTVNTVVDHLCRLLTLPDISAPIFCWIMHIHCEIFFMQEDRKMGEPIQDFAGAFMHKISLLKKYKQDRRIKSLGDTADGIANKLISNPRSFNFDQDFKEPFKDILNILSHVTHRQSFLMAAENVWGYRRIDNGETKVFAVFNRADRPPPPGSDLRAQNAPISPRTDSDRARFDASWQSAPQAQWERNVQQNVQRSPDQNAQQNVRQNVISRDDFRQQFVNQRSGLTPRSAQTQGYVDNSTPPQPSSGNWNNSTGYLQSPNRIPMPPRRLSFGDPNALQFQQQNHSQWTQSQMHPYYNQGMMHYASGPQYGMYPHNSNWNQQGRYNPDPRWYQYLDAPPDPRFVPPSYHPPSYADPRVCPPAAPHWQHPFFNPVAQGYGYDHMMRPKSPGPNQQLTLPGPKGSSSREQSPRPSRSSDGNSGDSRRRSKKESSSRNSSKSPNSRSKSPRGKGSQQHSNAMVAQRIVSPTDASEERANDGGERRLPALLARLRVTEIHDEPGSEVTSASESDGTPRRTIKLPKRSSASGSCKPTRALPRDDSSDGNGDTQDRPASGGTRLSCPSSLKRSGSHDTSQKSSGSRNSGDNSSNKFNRSTATSTTQSAKSLWANIRKDTRFLKVKQHSSLSSKWTAFSNSLLRNFHRMNFRFTTSHQNMWSTALLNRSQQQKCNLLSSDVESEGADDNKDGISRVPETTTSNQKKLVNFDSDCNTSTCSADSSNSESDTCHNEKVDGTRFLHLMTATLKKSDTDDQQSTSSASESSCDTVQTFSLVSTSITVDTKPVCINFSRKNHDSVNRLKIAQNHDNKVKTKVRLSNVTLRWYRMAKAILTYAKLRRFEDVVLPEIYSTNLGKIPISWKWKAMASKLGYDPLNDDQFFERNIFDSLEYQDFEQQWKNKEKMKKGQDFDTKTFKKMKHRLRLKVRLFYLRLHCSAIVEIAQDDALHRKLRNLGKVLRRLGESAQEKFEKDYTRWYNEVRLYNLAERIRSAERFLNRTKDPSLRKKLKARVDDLVDQWIIEDSADRAEHCRTNESRTLTSNSCRSVKLREKLRRYLSDNFIDHRFSPEFSFVYDGAGVFKYILTEDFADDQLDSYSDADSDTTTSSTSSTPSLSTSTYKDFLKFLLRIDPEQLSWFDIRILLAFTDTFADEKNNSELRDHLLKQFQDYTTNDPKLLDWPYKLFHLLVDCLPPSCMLFYKPLYSENFRSDESQNDPVSNVKEDFSFWNDVAERPETILFRVEQQLDDYHSWMDEYDADDENLTTNPYRVESFKPPKPIRAHGIRALLADVQEAEKDNPDIDFKSNLITDSGCPLSMTNVKENLKNKRKCKYVIHTANKDSAGDLKATICGDYHFSVRDINGRVHDLVLKGTLFVPDVSHTLIGTYHLNQNNHKVVHDYPFPSYIGVNREHIVPFRIVDGLYLLPLVKDKEKESQVSTVAFSAQIKNQEKDLQLYDLWHCRLCHVGSHFVTKMPAHVKGMPRIRLDLDASRCCHACHATKAQLMPKKRSTTRPARVLEWWSLDAVPMKTKAMSGAVMLTVFVDQLSRYVIVFPNTSRTEHSENLKQVMTFIHYMNSKFDTDFRIAKLQSDCAPEYDTPEMVRFYNDHGIKHDKTGPYDPRANGLCERMNGTLTTMIRSIMNASCVPEFQWPYAAQHAAFVLNRLPQLQDLSGRSLSPYELIFKKQPSANDIHVFGCLITMFLPKAQHYFYGRDWKLSCRGIPCYYLGTGYFRGQKVYLGYSPLKKRVFASDSARFHENYYPCRPADSRLVKNLEFYNPDINLPK